MTKVTDDKENPIKKYENESFVNDECGDYMWDEALEAFEKNQEKKTLREPNPRRQMKPSRAKIDHV